jgi:hypothetical protein
MDTLDYKQLSQNIDGSVTYNFKKTETQNHRLNFIASYQESTDKQGSVSLPGNVSRFLNSSVIYNLTLLKKDINIMASANYSYSYGGMIESHTWGPMLGITAGFFKKKLMAGFSTAYNVNTSNGTTQTKVFNLRVSSSYVLFKKHNISANLVWQNRNLISKNTKTDAITTTFAYSFSF